MKNRKTLVIFLVVIVAVVAIVIINRRRKEREMLYNQQQQALQQTTGTGLLGYFSNLFKGNQSDGSEGQMSESDAKAISQKIADFLETESEAGAMQADTLKKELYANGWVYVGYNSVTPV